MLMCRSMHKLNRYCQDSTEAGASFLSPTSLTHARHLPFFPSLFKTFCCFLFSFFFPASLQRQLSTMLPNLLSFLALFFGVAIAQCPDYLDYSEVRHYPYSGGVRNISYQRPDPACRTFNLSVLEDQVILDVMHATPDLDLFRLFLNGRYYLPLLNTGAHSSQPTPTRSIRPFAGRVMLLIHLMRSLLLSSLEISMPCG